MRVVIESPPPPSDREIVALELDECHVLLGLEAVGRVAIQADDGPPDVLPVNFVLLEGAPVFRTHDGSPLAHLHGRPVSLQADRFDWFHRTGWSVLVQGRAELVEPGDLESVDIDSWAPGDQPTLVRIIPARISGRRIELHQLPVDSWGYL
jgi:nitroimidazol reductase NimA-like FMN-containing flavoprotein (pyridoxamine 5'-phosphate oxidase superfamily)